MNAQQVMRLRDTMGIKYAELVYNGFWFSPEMEFLKHSMNKAQEPVSGTVDVRPTTAPSPAPLSPLVARWRWCGMLVLCAPCCLLV